jgi:large subunit ribosomal protein L6
MSRIGNKPITIPAGVKVEIDGQKVTVTGPKGTLSMDMNTVISAQVEGNILTVTRPNDEKESKALHGLTRSLLNNMVTGVETGFKKQLEINGVGYRAAKQGNELVMNLGYSHQVRVAECNGLTIEVPSPNTIIVSGADKQKVGQLAAEIREKRPPEPYKGKGIKYVDEVIQRKEGKAGKGKK